MLLIIKIIIKIIDKKREIIDSVVYNKEGEKMAQKKGFLSPFMFI